MQVFENKMVIGILKGLKTAQGNLMSIRVRRDRVAVAAA